MVIAHGFGENAARQRDEKILDDWFAELGDDISRIEAVANLTTLSDLFTAYDLRRYEEDLSQLARTLARCWQGLLKVRFPDRDFVVEVYDDEASEGPEVTFFTRAT